MQDTYVSKWTKHIATWVKSDSLAPSIEYDNPRMEFILRVGNEEIDIPREAIDDLLKLAGWDVVLTSDVDRAMQAIKELQDEAATSQEAREALEARISPQVRSRPAPRAPRVPGSITKLMLEAIEALRQRDDTIEFQNSQIRQYEKEIAGLRTGMGQIIASAQKEIDRLKEKCGE